MDVEKTIESLVRNAAKLDSQLQGLTAHHEIFAASQERLAANLDRTNAVLMQFIEHFDSRKRSAKRGSCAKRMSGCAPASATWMNAWASASKPWYPPSAK